MTAVKFSRPPARAALVRVVKAALEDMKAVNIKVLDVRQVTDVADCMIVASGNSDRHVRSIADRVAQRAKEEGFRPLGLEGQRDGEWVLVDLNDVIVHVMLPRVREFYQLESLWEPLPKKAAPRKKAAATKKASAKKKTTGLGQSASRQSVSRKKAAKKSASRRRPRSR
jgi:ribosome silencing factor RsfS/YbeB/iojap